MSGSAAFHGDSAPAPRRAVLAAPAPYPPTAARSTSAFLLPDPTSTPLQHSDRCVAASGQPIVAASQAAAIGLRGQQSHGLQQQALHLVQQLRAQEHARLIARQLQAQPHSYSDGQLQQRRHIVAQTQASHQQHGDRQHGDRRRQQQLPQFQQQHGDRHRQQQQEVRQQQHHNQQQVAQFQLQHLHTAQAPQQLQQQQHHHNQQQEEHHQHHQHQQQVAQLQTAQQQLTKSRAPLQHQHTAQAPQHQQHHNQQQQQQHHNQQQQQQQQQQQHQQHQQQHQDQQELRVALEKVPSDGIRGLGLLAGRSALFVFPGDVQHLLHKRTTPMLKELAERTEKLCYDDLKSDFHVFLGGSGAGKTTRMLQVALDEARCDVVVYCHLAQVSDNTEIRRAIREGQKLPIMNALRDFVQTRAASAFSSPGTKALLLDECGVCPEFIRVVAAEYHTICREFLGGNLVIIAAGTGAVSGGEWASHIPLKAITLEAPAKLRADLERKFRCLKRFAVAGCSKWYEAMMRNSRAATCLARAVEDLDHWITESGPAELNRIAAFVLTNAAVGFTRLNALARSSLESLRQVHLRAARIVASDITEAAKRDNVLIAGLGILIDQWAGFTADAARPHPRYVLDPGGHAVLLLCCGGLAGSLGVKSDSFKTDAVQWLTWCFAVCDAEQPRASQEGAHFHAIFPGANDAVAAGDARVPLASAPAKTASAKAASALMSKIVEADTMDFCRTVHLDQHRTTRTFVLKHRIDRKFMESLPAKLVEMGALDVADAFRRGKISSLRELAIALANSKDHTPTADDDDDLPFPLMQAVLDTKKDVWVFQNGAKAEFADVIVVWNNAVWLLHIKQHMTSAEDQQWQIFHGEHKMGSDTVEAKYAACVAATTPELLFSSKRNKYTQFIGDSGVLRAELFAHLEAEGTDPTSKTLEQIAPGVDKTFEQTKSLIAFLFGARKVRRAHVLCTDEAAEQAGVLDGIALRKIAPSELVSKVPATAAVLSTSLNDRKRHRGAD